MRVSQIIPLKFWSQSQAVPNATGQYRKKKTRRGTKIKNIKNQETCETARFQDRAPCPPHCPCIHCPYHYLQYLSLAALLNSCGAACPINKPSAIHNPYHCVSRKMHLLGTTRTKSDTSSFIRSRKRFGNIKGLPASICLLNSARSKINGAFLSVVQHRALAVHFWDVWDIAGAECAGLAETWYPQPRGFPIGSLIFAWALEMTSAHRIVCTSGGEALMLPACPSRVAGGSGAATSDLSPALASFGFGKLHGASLANAPARLSFVCICLEPNVATQTKNDVLQ